MRMEELIELLVETGKDLTDAQKEKVKTCETIDELIAFVNEGGIELPDEVLDMVAGGVQAGLFTGGGSGEFGPKNPEDPKPPRSTWF